MLAPTPPLYISLFSDYFTILRIRRSSSQTFRVSHQLIRRSHLLPPYFHEYEGPSYSPCCPAPFSYKRILRLRKQSGEKEEPGN